MMGGREAPGGVLSPAAFLFSFAPFGIEWPSATIVEAEPTPGGGDSPFPASP